MTVSKDVGKTVISLNISLCILGVILIYNLLCSWCIGEFLLFCISVSFDWFDLLAIGRIGKRAKRGITGIIVICFDMSVGC